MYSKKDIVVLCVGERVHSAQKDGENLEQLLVDKWYYTAYNMG